MVNYRAKEIVSMAEDKGLTHQEMADICGVTLSTIYRWKKEGRARGKVIARLEEILHSGEGAEELFRKKIKKRKYLEDASLEDLAERARELGFQVSFTDVRK